MFRPGTSPEGTVGDRFMLNEREYTTGAARAPGGAPSALEAPHVLGARVASRQAGYQ